MGAGCMGMQHALQLVLVAVCAALLPAHMVLAELPLPPNLVALHSLAGEKMLLEAKLKSDYFLLSEHFVQQQTWTYCGVASSAMVLNALGTPRPLQDPASHLNKPEYAYFTQDNVFDNSSEKVVPKAVVERQGLDINQLSLFLGAHDGVSASFLATQQSFTLTQQLFRDAALKALALPAMFVIVNFDRSLLREMGGGHHSPVAAYHAASDSLLVLDVSRYKYEAWWVPVAQLHASSTSSLDPLTNMTRGLVFAWAADMYPNQPSPITSAPVPANTDNGLPEIQADAPAVQSMSTMQSSQQAGVSPGTAAGLLVVVAVASFALGTVVVLAYQDYRHRHFPRAQHSHSHAGLAAGMANATQSFLAGAWPGYHVAQGYRPAAEGDQEGDSSPLVASHQLASHQPALTSPEVNTRLCSHDSPI